MRDLATSAASGIDSIFDRKDIEMTPVEFEARLTPPPFLDLLRPRATGNVLVTLRQGSLDAQLHAIESAARRLRVIR